MKYMDYIENTEKRISLHSFCTYCIDLDHPTYFIFNTTLFLFWPLIPMRMTVSTCHIVSLRKQVPLKATNRSVIYCDLRKCHDNLVILN